jgi:hypothetical protein
LANGTSLRSTSATDAPSDEKRRAVASPMPEAAPVTMTTFPSKRFMAAHS